MLLPTANKTDGAIEAVYKTTGRCASPDRPAGRNARSLPGARWRMARPIFVHVSALSFVAMLRNTGVVLLIAACLCLLPPAIGWFENGVWGYPGFTIGGMLDAVSLSNKLGPLEPFLNSFLPFNPGWVLAFVGMICFMVSQSRSE